LDGEESLGYVSPFMLARSSASILRDAIRISSKLIATVFSFFHVSSILVLLCVSLSRLSSLHRTTSPRMMDAGNTSTYDAAVREGDLEALVDELQALGGEENICCFIFPRPPPRTPKDAQDATTHP
jgi:hypothetical protein